VTDTQIDYGILKSRMKDAWMDGDFGVLAKYGEYDAEQFMARRTVKPGMAVLDVACGTGNLAVQAAKRGASVTGVDIATNLLEQGRRRVHQEGLAVQFDEGDAEELPYPDGSFDLVVSMWGAMFAPRPERVAAELVRVCRPGGTIAMANWTPGGMVGQMGKALSAHVPPPNIAPPVLWGDKPTVRTRFQADVAQLELTPRMAALKFPFSVNEVVDLYRTYYGPMRRAFMALPKEKQSVLQQDLENVFSHHNLADDGTTHVAAEYLEVVAVRA
jgi:ubiquinone/menaquinone biosynthesis C-methylase UbiE